MTPVEIKAEILLMTGDAFQARAASLRPQPASRFSRSGIAIANMPPWFPNPHPLAGDPIEMLTFTPLEDPYGHRRNPS
jgi:hypothetical protein